MKSINESKDAYLLVNHWLCLDAKNRHMNTGSLPAGSTEADVLEAWRYIASHWKAREQAGKCAQGDEWAPFWAEHQDAVLELKASVEG